MVSYSRDIILYDLLSYMCVCIYIGICMNIYAQMHVCLLLTKSIGIRYIRLIFLIGPENN